MFSNTLRFLVSFFAFLFVFQGCSPANVEALTPPPKAGCVFMDAGTQANMFVGGYEMPPADVLGQVCWQKNGDLLTYDGPSLDVPISESWSYILFYRPEEGVYTPASLKVAVEFLDPTYEVVGCQLELTLEAGRSRWVDCFMEFDPIAGTARLDFGETSMDAEASWMSEN